MFSPAGARIYSPETCCILPGRINSALTANDTYDKFSRLIELVVRYQGELDDHVRLALIQYRQRVEANAAYLRQLH